jgi:hypothetical protein
MFRKLILTGVLGIGTVAGLTATPTTAEAGCRPERVVYRYGHRHVGYRHVVVERPGCVIVRPCIR